MIPNEEKEGWHYLAVIKLSGILRKITSKDNGDFNCLNSLPFLEQKISLRLIKKDERIKIFVEMYCHQKRRKY